MLPLQHVKCSVAVDSLRSSLAGNASLPVTNLVTPHLTNVHRFIKEPNRPKQLCEYALRPFVTKDMLNWCIPPSADRSTRLRVAATYSAPLLV